jgi:hypothetical protein
MSTPFQFSNPQTPGPPPPPAPAKKRGSWITSKPFLILAALIVGLVLGTNSAGGAAKSAPAVTVTTAGPAVTRTLVQYVTPTATVATTVTAQPAPPAGTFKDGTWLVNKDIKPGQYRSDNVSGDCYWERLKDTSGGMDAIIAIEDGSGPMLVTIKPTDAAFKSTNCGEWRPV